MNEKFRAPNGHYLQESKQEVRFYAYGNLLVKGFKPHRLIYVFNRKIWEDSEIQTTLDTKNPETLLFFQY